MLLLAARFMIRNTGTFIYLINHVNVLLYWESTLELRIPQLKELLSHNEGVADIGTVSFRGQVFSLNKIDEILLLIKFVQTLDSLTKLTSYLLSFDRKTYFSIIVKAAGKSLLSIFQYLRTSDVRLVCPSISSN